MSPENSESTIRSTRCAELLRFNNSIVSATFSESYSEENSYHESIKICRQNSEIVAEAR